jgi:predicted dehydrogenase
MLKILVVGLGSIGSRHLNCLSNVDGIEVAALRTSNGTLKKSDECAEFFSVQDALSFKPSGVIISNPTSLHVETALPFLRSGIPVLIEKPIAATSEEVKPLIPFADLVRVAYCMRFHPLYVTLKKVIKSERVFKVGFRRSFYLPKWHPYADYRLEYTARRDLGGGVVRTLSHEIDLMVHWFGIPTAVKGVTDKVSDLEIDTDDYAFFTCSFKEGFRVNFELDLLSPANVNSGEAFTEYGKHQWDLTGLSFTPYANSEPESRTEFTTEMIDVMYLDQIKDFLQFVCTGSSRNATLSDSAEVLKIIESLNA